MKYNEEILANNIELLTKGAIEKRNIDTCMIFGISGNCGKNCPKFKDKTCEEYLTTLENEYNSLQQENQQLKKQKDELQKEMDYVDDYNRHLLNKKDDVVEYMKNYIELEDAPINERIKIEFKKILKQTYFILSDKRIQSNWNSLREWIKQDLKQVYRDCGHRNNIMREVLDKMNELEKSDSNN